MDVSAMACPGMGRAFIQHQAAFSPSRSFLLWVGEWAAQGNTLILTLDFKESGAAEVPEWLLPFL